MKLKDRGKNITQKLQSNKSSSPPRQQIRAQGSLHHEHHQWNPTKGCISITDIQKLEFNPKVDFQGFLLLSSHLSFQGQNAYSAEMSSFKNHNSCLRSTFSVPIFIFSNETKWELEAKELGSIQRFFQVFLLKKCLWFGWLDLFSCTNRPIALHQGKRKLDVKELPKSTVDTKEKGSKTLTEHEAMWERN